MRGTISSAVVRTENYRGDVNPVRPRRRRAFLKEHLRSTPSGRRTTRSAGRQLSHALNNRQEMLHEIALRDAGLWKEHF